jgi:transcriptional regulator with XRE-family HTH domain
MGLSQRQAALRSGVSFATWRRMEAEGKASITDLIEAALALRCDPDIGTLFPPLAAATMDELLAQQDQGPVRKRAPRAKRP